MNDDPRLKNLVALTSMYLVGRIFFLIACCWSNSLPAADPTSKQFTETIQPFLSQHCQRCHNNETTEGEFDLATQLTLDFESRQTKSHWSEVVNVLNSHEMPPEKEPQPDPAEVARVTDWIIAQLVIAEQLHKSSSTIVRRLNRSQYARTIRDLVHVNYDTNHFPLDPTAAGFDNNGSALTIAPTQLELYLDAARDIIDRAINVGDQPTAIHWRFEPESGDSDSNRVTYDGQRVIVNGGRNRVEGDGRTMHHSSWDTTINARDFRLDSEGDYRIRVRAGGRVPSRDDVVAAMEKFLEHRFEQQMKENPKGEKYHRAAWDEAREHFQTDSDYDYGPPRLRLIQDWKGQPRVVAEFDVDASMDAPQTYEFSTRFPAAKSGITLEYAYSIPKELENYWCQGNEGFARPEAWIDWVEIEGPVYEAWPPASHQRLFPESPLRKTDERAYAAGVLKRFMSFAYRRPVTGEEVTAKLKLYDAALRDQPDAVLEDTLRPALISVLVSPNFLYLAEPKTSDSPLTPYELATRLSYFLWSTMPDETLLRAATKGELTTTQGLSAQLQRMLVDVRSQAFVEDFASQWLGIREIGANPPAEDLYPEYDRHLEISLREESLAFFREILDNDLSVLNCLKSDFVVINERLGRFYEIPDVRGDQFRRVAVSNDAHRGGIITQASVLSITSNGTRTSPVKRGVWILKTLLGTDPGLPVANAGDIAPKVPGIDKATVRQRLEIHRELAQCARCHNKIDPLGFALENYNAAGKWRDREGFGYKGRIGHDDPLVDASSRLPDGTAINGVGQLQLALLERKDLFLRCLSTKLLGYALGREVVLSDTPTVEAIVVAAKTKQYSLRSMLEAVVLSPAFRSAK